MSNSTLKKNDLPPANILSQTKLLGELHSFQDQPAVIFRNGTKQWYEGGKLHRVCGPAVIFYDGTEEYYLQGKRHRYNGPAVISKNFDSKEWWSFGKRHRMMGPAVVKVHVEEYWEHGERHRLHGPAVIFKDGTNEYWQRGKKHRTDGPAVEYANGDKDYFVNDKLHREDGPASIRAIKEQYWIEGNFIKEVLIQPEPVFVRRQNCGEYYIHNKLHREDGPARLHDNGNEDWYYEGKLHREDGPAVIVKGGKNSRLEFYKHGKLHRDDGPAIIYENGRKEWYLNGAKHRIDGPAVEDKIKEWWIDGQEVTNLPVKGVFPQYLNIEQKHKTLFHLLNFLHNKPLESLSIMDLLCELECCLLFSSIKAQLFQSNKNADVAATNFLRQHDKLFVPNTISEDTIEFSEYILFHIRKKPLLSFTQEDCILNARAILKIVNKYANRLTEDHAKKICKVGCGRAECKYLDIGSKNDKKVYTCLKLTDFKESIEYSEALAGDADGPNAPRGDNCLGLPHPYFK